MQQRLEQFLAAENLSKSQFADRINVARAGITHIMAGRNNPSYEFIINTMNAFPQLNIEWLLKGTGRMYKSSPAEQLHQAETLPATEPTVSVNLAEKRGSRSISRITVFFEDGTFREFC